MGSLPEAAQIEILRLRLAGIVDVMVATLRRASVSRSLRERADFSCAIFDAAGRMLAEEGPISAHLGSMGLAVRAVLAELELSRDAVAIVNDPFCGGTQLPALTLVSAVYLPVELGGARIAFVACRARHADLGGASPGATPVGTQARPGSIPELEDVPAAVGPRYLAEDVLDVDRRSLSIADEGILIPPSILDAELTSRIAQISPRPQELRTDLAAQRAALVEGAGALIALTRREGRAEVERAFARLHDHGARLMSACLRELPDGIYPFADSLDDDGAGRSDISLRVVLRIEDGRAIVDLSESDDETDGSLNAVRAVTEAAVAYAFRLLLPPDAPTNDGLRAPIEIVTRAGSICDTQAPRAVAAGSSGTAQRIVDLLLGALAQACPERIPAGSGGSTSQLLLGDGHGACIEAIAGGAGAGPLHAGQSAVQTHLSNTRNTPIEVLEAMLPVRAIRYAVRRNSGGGGTHRGGDGLVRELELLAAMTVTLIGERRRRPPHGLAGGGPGLPGEDSLERGGRTRRLPAKLAFEAEPGDRLRIETPGGGGFGDSRKGKFWAAVMSGAALTREDLGG